MKPARLETTTTATLGRILVLLLLLAALWNPRLPLGRATMDLILVLDESSSMDPAFIDHHWRNLLEFASALPPGSRFSFIRFGGRSATEIRNFPVEKLHEAPFAQRETPPRRRDIERNQTDLEQALRSALLELEPGRNSTILLLSDGIQTRGSLSRVFPSMREPPTRLLWFRPPAAPRSSLRIASLAVPDRVYSGQPASMGIGLRGKAGTRARVTARLDGVPFLDEEAQIPARGTLSITAHLPMPGSGIHLLEVEAGQAGMATGSTLRHAVIQVPGPARILHLNSHPWDSPVATDLRRGGWKVQSVKPGELQAGQLAATDLILVEDLPADALPETAWKAMEKAVTQQGKGLLVLGGPHAFGAGGYRGSILEELLPVTAESRTPLPRAAVLFLLDSSGSMARNATPEGESRMAIARQAIREAAGLLQPGDSVGLMAFDTAPRMLLPPASHPGPAKRVAESWRGQPHGGTRLAPALEAAAKALAKTDAEQRIIVLVSDGHIESDADFSTVAAALSRENIDLVALLIGQEQLDSPLAALTRINHGRLLPVSEVIRLPVLMRNEISQRRSAVEAGETLPRPGVLPPWLANLSDSWPPLTGYAITRPKPGATVHLRSQKGDPLLASHFAGLGRVVALPAGLDQWASHWKRWDKWGLLIGGLVEWAGNGGPNGLHLRHEITAEGVQFSIDAASDDLASWDASGELQLRILDPAGMRTPVKTQLVAPGRYVARFSPSLAGLHRVHLVLGERHYRSAFYYRPLAELDSTNRTPDELEKARDEKVVRAWEPGMPLEPPADDRRLETRPGLLLLALVFYLFTLARERALDPKPRWLFQRRMS